ncbi:MAG: pantoate--beta-alanine ligase [Clostridia bacterium]|nr:pantoate--beta-alanine ligase [Clostridia bacterium]MDD4047997.1 pantoate--beta-alanine ligase [Clostridia bacterium]
MLVLKTIKEVREWINGKRINGKKVGFIPTMGSLHEGHLSLARVARKENELVVMSIFVNPLQFGPQEDYMTYPRDLEKDSRLAEKVGVDMMFAPSSEELYPTYPQLTTVEVTKITEKLCGISRPGHFKGVATVVTKLFNIIMPDKAYFGQKDYQQVQVIKKMVGDLNFPVEIRTVPIKREDDGLAMSSRNAYLTKEERQRALCLQEALKACQVLYRKGERKTERIIKVMKERIDREQKIGIEYIKICDAITLEEVQDIEGTVVVALAVKVGSTRLIDNILLGDEEDV